MEKASAATRRVRMWSKPHRSIRFAKTKRSLCPGAKNNGQQFLASHQQTFVSFRLAVKNIWNGVLAVGEQAQSCRGIDGCFVSIDRLMGSEQ